jgi:hypothetical protein
VAVTPVEQVQQQISEAVEALRTRIEETVEQARVRAQDAADLALKVAYAYVGAVVVAQERVTLRVAELVNSR